MDDEIISTTTLFPYAADFRRPNGEVYRGKISWMAEDSVSAIDMALGWAEFIGETLVGVQRTDAFGRPMARMIPAAGVAVEHPEAVAA